MPELGLQQIVFLVAVVLFTLAAAISDYRSRRIPNAMTVPMFALGLMYQIGFNGWSGGERLAEAGLASALLAFLMGFGTLFVLWLIGGGGGGDVKLMGALSVWLGVRLTLWVLIFSTLAVLFGTLAVMFWSVVTRGPWKTKDKYLATGKQPVSKKAKPVVETIEQRKNRRIMAYAVPVALATWCVLIWRLPSL